MSYEDEPTQKLTSKARRTARRPIPLSPMPALEELVPQRSWGPEQANQPTEPLPRLTHTRSEQQAETPTVEQERTSPSNATAPGRLVPGLKPLKKLQRPYHLSYRLRALLFFLLVLGALGASGWYFLETAVIGPLSQFFHPVAWEGAGGAIDGRAWNLLLLGSDNDSKYAFPELLTQVLMVVHVDPLNKKVSLVSIPRDSWVPVPGQTGRYKLDQAFFLGSQPHHSFDDGVRLARTTIEQDYGIPIDRYAWVGLGSFARLIDTLGGIDIDLTHPLLDDTYPDDTGKGADPRDPYAMERLYLVPGPQHLNGEQALEYVRSRHADLIGDIGRTQRQQEVLAALKKKLNAGNLFDHLPQLLRGLSGQIYTDLSQGEMLSVATFARDLPASAIARLTLGPGQGSHNYGSLTQSNDLSQGEPQDILIPNCATIQPEVNRVFGLGDVESCRVGG